MELSRTADNAPYISLYEENTSLIERFELLRSLG